jgi:hypothetical protein
VDDDESQLPLQQSPLPPQGIPGVRQQRWPEVVTLLFVQTAPVGCWQQSSSDVHAHEDAEVQRLPSAA